ncbi:MAG: thioredoxin fold domain-containing protein [Aphanizomenon flos-aquae DEX188]|jgi:thiol-disulfide isomerase/thioredoxin|nr:thioredoxin fold domain-containing protein [Nostocales cyanobacterium W4_Combined_metabat2_030]QSV67098.1 MAG: thioredoxin fold domain-containing protein [Aphanizomenon flos-aquae DEX188]
MSTEVPVNSSNRIKNFLIAIVAIALGIVLFLGLKTDSTSVSLMDLSKTAIPLEVAVSNGKPSLVEFYADWCSVCQKMTPDMAKLRKQYENSLNFVMLNVDNTKWLPEMLKYRVDGIPHFVFLGKQGETIAETIGDMPRTIMASNLEALIAGSTLPHVQDNGKTSQFSAPVATDGNQDDPRSHGSQVVN